MFLDDNFMLKNKTAVSLYNDFAKDLPIIDYHCHLNPKQIAENYKFKNAYDLFLGEIITSGGRCARTELTKNT